MDADRIDLLARSLMAPSRRAFSRWLAGLTLVGGLGVFAGPADVDGKKKGKGNTRKKKCSKTGGKAIKGTCCQGSARVCSGGCAYPSIQKAISNARRGANITVCPGTYREHLTIAFGKNVTLTGFGDGEGSGDTILENPGNNGAVVVVGTGTTATFQHLRIVGRSGSGVSVNGLQNSGTARLTNCTISGHKSTSLYTYGGGIDNRGVLSLTDCVVSGNAAGTGGGIFSSGGNVSLTGCTINENVSALYGGGIWSDGTLVVTDSEISGNAAEANGGGIYNESTVTLDAASRVTGNTADDGGGIYNSGGTVTLASAANVTGNTQNNCAGDAVPLCNG
jgi:hypothetical protein